MAIANISGNILTDSGVATSSLLPLTGGTLTGALNGTSAVFSSSVGTAALNMNNMSALGSISGGSIYLPYTATINFRSADGSSGYGSITADTSSNLIFNSGAGFVGIGMTPDVPLQVKVQSGNITRMRLGPSASGFELSQDNGGFTACTIKNIYATTNNAAELSLQSGFITFKVGTSLLEKFRMLSNGRANFNGGSTDRGYQLQVMGDASSYACEIRQNGGAYSYELLTLTHEATSGYRQMVIFNAGGYGTVGKIECDNSNTYYRTSSDYRLKEDFKNYNGLEILNKIKTYDFKWKGQEDKRDYGVIAHELQEVFPAAVGGIKDEVKEDGTINPQGVDYSKLVPILVKAIQELEAKVSVLENKS